ncbi:MAG TPA: hypothetical protein VK386_10665 [Acidimicrobiales bacterium]|nr:hypothetical protein [Acidimicrobiales bacterium]
MDVATQPVAPVAVRSPTPTAGGARPVSPRWSDLRRFVTAVVLGSAVAGAPFLWMVFDLWAGFDLERRAYNSKFYDAQAEAIMHGHLWVSKNVLDIEAFKHGGHYYTYFGVFPSLLRIPLLLLFPHLYGHLTAPFICVAWICTAVLSSMLMWRVRLLVRKDAMLGIGEAACYGVLAASVCGCAVFMVLASIPWVYHEDVAWSIALTIGTLFCLLGMLERPSRGRLVFTGLFVVAANLNRLPTGWACVVGTMLVAGWFATGRGPAGGKRWAIALAAVALLALCAGCAVTWLKFGSPFGLPLQDQRWTQINAHRREFLARNGDKGYNFDFFPTDFWAYFQPFGIRLQAVFPFVTLPAVPPTIFNGAYFDQWYPTASVPAAMPLLFLLSCLGTVLTFTRNSSRTVRAMRLLLFAGVAGFGVSLVWSYITPRFEGDVVPFLVIASAAGMAHLWNAIGARRPRSRRWAVTGVTVLGAFSLVAGLGIGLAPNTQWTEQQTKALVRTELAFSDVMGNPIRARIHRATALPHYAPAGRILVIDNCRAAYISDGEDFQNEPPQYREHATWLPIEQGPGIRSVIYLDFTRIRRGESGPSQAVLSAGAYTLSVQVVSYPTIRFILSGPGIAEVQSNYTLTDHQKGKLDVIMDPYLQLASATWFGVYVFEGFLPASGTVVVHPQAAGNARPTSVVVRAEPRSAPNMGLCHRLLRKS